MPKVKTFETFMKDAIVKKLYSTNVGQKCLAKTVCQIYQHHYLQYFY